MRRGRNGAGLGGGGLGGRVLRGHSYEWRHGFSIPSMAMPELQLVGLCILPKKVRFQGCACWGGWVKGVASSLLQLWSFFLFIHPCWSLNLRTQALDRRRLQGTSPYPYTLDPFYTFMPIGWSPLLLGSTAEALPSWLLSSPIKGTQPTLPQGPLPVPSKPVRTNRWPRFCQPQWGQVEPVKGKKCRS